MSPVHHDERSPRVRQFMDAVYRLGVATVAEATAAIDDPPTETAVRTMLGNLVRRGMLRKEFDGRAAVYRPVQSRRRAGKTALRRVLDTFFGGATLLRIAGAEGDLGPGNALIALVYDRSEARATWWAVLVDGRVFGSSWPGWRAAQDSVGSPLPRLWGPALRPF